ncbi:arsenate reductase (glutaredoxin) [Candidatus Marinamargulisbacteria bacterium SCGC AG-343-D04]|nr:arsenate reductase (glutaredoxin) [Candidatus Marinamargulisbacteria bacterium SCGC AG-343-D04]
MRLFHNPRCSKSRQALALLNDSNKTFEIIHYLVEGIQREDLKRVFHFLSDDYHSLIRAKEAAAYGYSNQDSLDDVFNLILEHPSLLQRPLLLSSSFAIVARPPELIHSCL